MSDHAARKLAGLSPEAKRAMLAKLLREKAKASDRPEWVPVSHNQKALWFLHRLAPQSAAYHLLYAAHIPSQLNTEALQRVVHTLTQRYPVLTASYRMHNGEPMQLVQKSHTITVEPYDVPALDLAQLKQQVITESNRPIDLEQGPMLRILLYRRSPDDYILALIAHHIAVDFLALDILVDELYELYLAEQLGVPAQLPAITTTSTDYARWQNELITSPEGERHWQYWQQALAGELPVLNLPLDRPRPPVQTYQGASHYFTVSDDLTQQLRSLARREKTTLFTVMLAAYQTLLLRSTNQEDLIVGTPALGRGHTSWERVMGYLVNPVMIRTRRSEKMTFLKLLEQARQGTLDALEHQDFPFPLLVERLQPRRDPSYAPIYQTLFIWDRPRKQQSQQGLQFEPLVFGQQGAQNDLTLTIFEIKGALSAEFRYNTDLFEAATIARMAGHFLTLLAGIVANPDQLILQLPLLTEEEQHQTVIAWNNTQHPYPDHACLHQLIEAQAELTPEHTALIYEGQQRTYQELNREANQLAHRLQEAGVGPDILVGVCMERSLEMVIALLAILKAGGAYVPLDPTYPHERLTYMIKDAHVPILLTQSHIQKTLPAIDATILCLDADWHAGIVGQEKNTASAVGPDNLAYMIYTSGSSGKPKGVMNIHRSIVNRLHWMQQEYKLTPDDRVLQKTPFSFDVSVWEFFWPLLNGSTLVIARPGGHQDPAYLARLIAEQGVTTIHFVPSMLQAFLVEPDLAQTCRSLQRVICSGELLSAELQEQFFTRFPAPVELHNLYGPTEAAVDVTHWACQRGDTSTIVPIGRPIANTRIYILNAEMQPVPAGIPGELHIGGIGLARGYHDQAELTAAKFVADPFSDDKQARLFKTADLARYRSDGAIEYLGRIDHQVKIRGFRIELGEIESELASHPGIKEVVVTAREDIPGNKRLVAYVVARPRSEHPGVEALRNYLKDRLPSYMIPATFLYLEAMPLSPNGKVDRKALPAPTTARPELEAAYTAPATPTEQKLALIWSDVLNVDRVGIHDNFFDLGGASLQSLEVVNKAGEAGLKLPLELLFEYQTIAELAMAIDTQKSSVLVEPTIPVKGPENIERAEPQTIQPTQSPEKVTLDNMYIESLGTYLPPRIVSSQEIVKGCINPLRFPMERMTGINNRRMAGETEFALDLARKAIEDCLANSKYQPEDIDLLINCSISRGNHAGKFTFEPTSSIQLKQHFGFTNAIAFDVSNACTTLFTGMYIAEACIKTGLARRALVVSGEYITHLITTAQKEIENFMDPRMACLTVGDAGAALLLERSPDQKVGFHQFEMYTVGRYSEACIGKVTDQPHGGAIMYTDAVQVSAVNMKQAISHAHHIIEQAKWPYDAFQHILVHQTSKTTIQDVARAFNSYFGAEICSQDNVINNIAERANTATTTHMIAIMDYIRNGSIVSGENVLFGITGSGATIGTAIYTFDDLPDRIRRREAGTWQPEKVQPSTTFMPQLPTTRRIRIASIGTIAPEAEVPKTTLDLIQNASETCLAHSSYQKDEIDLMLFAGVYRDEFLCEPAVAALAEGRMGINDDINTQQEKKTFALDLLNSGIGALSACYTAGSLMLAGKGSTALIMASEVENNRNLSPSALMGVEETGSALLLDLSPDGKTGFGQFVFKDFPEYGMALQTRSETWQGKTRLEIIKDPRLEEYYLECIPVAVQELLEREQLRMEQIDLILPSQISSTFLDQLSTHLHVDRKKIVDVQAQGDLLTSSLAYTLHQAQQQGMAKPGSIGLIINVGAGIQVGCATYYF